MKFSGWKARLVVLLVCAASVGIFFNAHSEHRSELQIRYDNWLESHASSISNGDESVVIPTITITLTTPSSDTSGASQSETYSLPQQAPRSHVIRVLELIREADLLSLNPDPSEPRRDRSGRSIALSVRAGELTFESTFAASQITDTPPAQLLLKLMELYSTPKPQ